MHIHCVSLSTEMGRYVAPDEQLRADRLLDPNKRGLFLASRGVLREILGRYLGAQPEELQFVMGEHGKPYLSSNTRLNFNLSHSGTLFLLAIAANREVGIDVELLREDTPFTDIARHAFSPREQEELSALPEHLQRSAFYRCWTRKEAYLKACGMGFDLKSSSFDVSLLPEVPAPLIVPGDRSRWILQNITVPATYYAALAVQGSAAVIRYID